MATARLLVGDCREVLRTLPDGSVHCVVTSPPYFGLRDYGHDGQIGLESTPDEPPRTEVGMARVDRRAFCLTTNILYATYPRKQNLRDFVPVFGGFVPDFITFVTTGEAR